MKRIGILSAGGDTPALNATIHGAVVRAPNTDMSKRIRYLDTNDERSPVKSAEKLAIDYGHR